MMENLWMTSRNNLMSDAFFIFGRRLMFASLHGRDADMLAFQASLQSASPYGFNSRLGFRQPDEKRECPMLTTAETLTDLCKHITKYPTHHYGAVTHMFLYAGVLAEPDLDAKTGWVILDDVSADLDKAAWQCLQQLSDVPLLEHWQHRILDELSNKGCISRYLPAIDEHAAVVGVQAAKVAVPEDFGELVTCLLRNGSLRA
ncbi:hypothetical protein [Neisseria sp.]|uniref:hypothetical protein n=1 Tax=Neisseria sp. TaxID=192066 RepID=UPI0035A05A6F